MSRKIEVKPRKAACGRKQGSDVKVLPLAKGIYGLTEFEGSRTLVLPDGRGLVLKEVDLPALPKVKWLSGWEAEQVNRFVGGLPAMAEGYREIKDETGVGG